MFKLFGLPEISRQNLGGGQKNPAESGKVKIVERVSPEPTQIARSRILRYPPDSPANSMAKSFASLIFSRRLFPSWVNRLNSSTYSLRL